MVYPRCAFLLRSCLIWIVLIPTCSEVAAAQCPSDFDNRCQCGLVPHGDYHTDLIQFDYVVNCTDAGFDHTMMLRKLPPQTQVLVFTGNEIKDLPLNIFGQDVFYDKLHTIDFSNNHIQTIKGRTFHNVANVTKLVLNDNDLYIVAKDHHPRMFSNFVNLKELHLRNAFTEKVKAGDYLNNLAEIFENSSLTHLGVLHMEDNEIVEMFHGEFCSLPALRELYLANNHLKDISFNFSCHKDLKLLDVANNAIPYLSQSTLESLRATRYIRLNLTHNPFKCDCRMIETYDWMRITSLDLINRDNFYCYDGFPPNIGRNVMSLENDEFKCIPTLDNLDYHSSASFVLLTGGLVLFTIVVLILVYKHRSTVGTYMQRAVQPIRSKFYYVSLERRQTTMNL